MARSRGSASTQRNKPRSVQPEGTDPDIQQAQEFVRLTLEQEQALGERIQQGDPIALEELEEAHLRLVKWFVNRYMLLRGSSTISEEDLYQGGCLGLHRAVLRFDWSRGLRVSTYAGGWIKAGIREAEKEQRSNIRLPSGVIKQLQELRDKQRELDGLLKISDSPEDAPVPHEMTQQLQWLEDKQRHLVDSMMRNENQVTHYLGRDGWYQRRYWMRPDFEAAVRQHLRISGSAVQNQVLADLMRISVFDLEQLRQAAQAGQEPQSFDAPVREGSEGEETRPLGDSVPAKAEEEPEAVTETTFVTELLREAVGTFDELEQRILTLRFGLDGERGRDAKLTAELLRQERPNEWAGMNPVKITNITNRCLRLLARMPKLQVLGALLAGREPPSPEAVAEAEEDLRQKQESSQASKAALEEALSNFPLVDRRIFILCNGLNGGSKLNYDAVAKALKRENREWAHVTRSYVVTTQQRIFRYLEQQLGSDELAKLLGSDRPSSPFPLF